MSAISTSTPALLLQSSTGTTGLSDSKPVTNVVVHPMVLLSILDHHTRRQDGELRVIGTLLGRRDGEKVEVTNCFAVPHAERGDEVAIGKDFNRQMLALHLRANRNETVVGWYATAFPNEDEDAENSNNQYDNNCIADTSSLIHEFYAGECEDTIMDSPIHLVVDTSLVEDTIALKAYLSSAVVLDGETLANLFHELKLVLKSSESERIVLDQMIKNLGASDDAETAIEEKKDVEAESGLRISMEKLLSMLETASEYIGKVVDGEVEADDGIGRQIADTLSSVPRIRPEMFDKMYNDSLQDLLMVTYLSNITRTQLSISEKLNAALDVNLK
jgi:translation initiation factor 3 subunit F|eukprot:819616_1